MVYIKIQGRRRRPLSLMVIERMFKLYPSTWLVDVVQFFFSLEEVANATTAFG